MSSGLGCSCVLVGAVFLGLPSLASEGNAETKISYIANFIPQVGGHPSSQPILASDGNYWGVLPENSRNDVGSIYKLTPDGTLSVMHRFKGPDGQNPTARLLQASDGAIYGTTPLGGGKKKRCGVVFRITLGGDFSLLHIFDCGHDGANPSGGLIQGTDGRLYGLASGGGKEDAGIAYALTLNGEFTRFANFSIQNFGSNPIGELVQVNGGEFFGVTTAGGPLHTGSLFSISPDGILARHHAFSEDAPPNGQLAYSRTDDNLYGTLKTGNVFVWTGSSGSYSTHATVRYGTLTGGVTLGADGRTLYGYCMSATDGGCAYVVPAPHKVSRLIAKIKGEIDGSPMLSNSTRIVGTTNSGGSTGLGAAFTLDLPDTDK